MSEKKPTIKDVEKHCNENGYYVGQYWFPYINLKTKMRDELNKILINPDYAESLGIKVYVRVEDNGDKYAVLNNGEEEIELKLKEDE